jgi:hypothetical protein
VQLGPWQGMLLGMSLEEAMRPALQAHWGL